MLGNAFHWFLTAVLLYKYVAIFVIEFLGGVGVPVPATAALAASAFFAMQGYMDLWSVVAVGTVATVIGDYLGYWLSRKYGVRFIRRIGLGRLLESEAVKDIEIGTRHRPFLTV